MIDDRSDSQAREILCESLSVVMDGEASESDERIVLDSMESDDQLSETVKRFRKIGDCIRRQPSRFADIDLSAKISSAIDKEPSFTGVNLAESEPVPFYMHAGFMGKAGKIAVSIFVVFAVIIGVRSYTMLPNEGLIASSGMQSSMTALSQPIQGSHNAYEATGVLAGYNAKGSVNSFQDPYLYSVGAADQKVRERFRAYALQHAELSAISSGRGVMPFVRLTSFDVQ